MNSKQPTYSRPASASEAQTRCGYIALVGRPNAGKSTLFNSFLGQQLSIVTAKPQTTRSRILGILTRPQSQMIFLDTPGLLTPSYKLHSAMGRQIDLAVRDADVVLLLVDATRPKDRAALIDQFLKRNKAPLVAALNKIDLLDQAGLKAAQSQSSTFALEELLPISALKEEGTAALLERLEALLPYGPKLYPDDMIAEQPERFFVAELVRQAAFEQLSDELPYAINVAIEEFVEREQKTYIRATLHVERESQKGIVIGHRGARLRSIGKAARLDIEALLEAPVFLELWVKVRADWRNKDRDLKEFGYR